MQDNFHPRLTDFQFIEIITFKSNFSLIDLDTPTIGVSTLTPLEGTTLNFTCNIETTDTVLHYTWNHNNISLINQTSDILQLYNGNRNNSGYYTCGVTTTNLLQNTSDPVMVTYLCKYTVH